MRGNCDCRQKNIIRKLFQFVVLFVFLLSSPSSFLPLPPYFLFLFYLLFFYLLLSCSLLPSTFVPVPSSSWPSESIFTDFSGKEEGFCNQSSKEKRRRKKKTRLDLAARSFSYMVGQQRERKLELDTKAFSPCSSRLFFFAVFYWGGGEGQELKVRLSSRYRLVLLFITHGERSPSSNTQRGRKRDGEEG